MSNVRLARVFESTDAEAQQEIDEVNDRLAEAAIEQRNLDLDEWFRSTQQRPIHRVLVDYFKSQGSR